MKHYNRTGEKDDHGEYCARCLHGPLTFDELFDPEEGYQCSKCHALFLEAESMIPGKDVGARRAADERALAELTLPPGTPVIGRRP